MKKLVTMIVAILLMASVGWGHYGYYALDITCTESEDNSGGSGTTTNYDWGNSSSSSVSAGASSYGSSYGQAGSAQGWGFAVYKWTWTPHPSYPSETPPGGYVHITASSSSLDTWGSGNIESGSGTVSAKGKLQGSISDKASLSVESYGSVTGYGGMGSATCYKYADYGSIWWSPDPPYKIEDYGTFIADGQALYAFNGYTLIPENCNEFTISAYMQAYSEAANTASGSGTCYGCSTGYLSYSFTFYMR